MADTTSKDNASSKTESNSGNTESTNKTDSSSDTSNDNNNTSSDSTSETEKGEAGTSSSEKENKQNSLITNLAIVGGAALIMKRLPGWKGVGILIALYLLSKNKPSGEAGKENMNKFSALGDTINSTWKTTMANTGQLVSKVAESTTAIWKSSIKTVGAMGMNFKNLAESLTKGEHLKKDEVASVQTKRTIMTTNIGSSKVKFVY